MSSELERLSPLCDAATSGSGGGEGGNEVWTCEHDARLAEWIDGFSQSLAKAVREATAGLDALVRAARADMRLRNDSHGQP